jgi:hypothetical protein
MTHTHTHTRLKRVSTFGLRTHSDHQLVRSFQTGEGLVPLGLLLVQVGNVAVCTHLAGLDGQHTG